MQRKSLLENACGTTYVQNCYFAGKCSGNHHFNMHLIPNIYKIVTLQANTKKIITLKCMWHNICPKPLLCRQMLRKSLFKMRLTPNMYKIITLKEMQRKSLLENACGTTYVQNHYFAGKCSGNHHFNMHLIPNIYKIFTLQANMKKIVTLKCMWHHICAKPLL